MNPKVGKRKTTTIDMKIGHLLKASKKSEHIGENLAIEKNSMISKKKTAFCSIVKRIILKKSESLKRLFQE